MAYDLIGALLGGGIGTGFGAIGKAIDFGFGVAGSEMQYDLTRKLRRRQYQDMVYSLKKAGLNPVLAVGANPSTAMTSAIQTGMMGGHDGSGMANAMAGLSQADTAASIAPSQIDLNSAGGALRRIEAENEKYRRAGILQEYDKNAAWIEQTLQQARTSAAQALLFEAEAKRAGASEAEIRERTDQINRFGLPGQTWMGGLRAALADPNVAAGALGPLSNNANPTRLDEAWGWLMRTNEKNKQNPTLRPDYSGPQPEVKPFWEW